MIKVHNAYRKYMRKSMITACTLALLLAGCSSGTGSSADPVSKPRDVTKLTVLYASQDSFNQVYGEMLHERFPEYEFEVIPREAGTTETSYGYMINTIPLEEILAKQQPDLLMLYQPEYGKLAQQGQLLGLDSLVAQDKLDLGALVPLVTDYLKSEGGGKLYGLAPTFHSEALFYNASLFDQYGIPYPKDGMTNSELLQLAERFPTDGDAANRVYGYTTFPVISNPLRTLMDQMILMGHRQGLSVVDSTGTKIMSDGSRWRDLFNAMASVLHKGAWHLNYAPKDDLPDAATELYYSGRAAMIDGSYTMLTELEDYRSQHPDAPQFPNKLVRMPVNPDDPDAGSPLQLSEIIAINAKSTNTEAAWKVLQYLNGEEWAKSLEALGRAIPTYKSQAEARNGVSLLPFYEGQRLADRDDEPYDQMPEKFMVRFEEEGEPIFRDAVEGRKPPEEAFDEIVGLGQQLLESMKK
ncbi:ABC transporter substrate-binding protein [Paenibacillus sp. MMS18-CY102]|uniref:ABC transporter substrate-binding protein n=1 Tax=Paenibacillus sp. MMS18-CY102 TaxID=2682849 RepID=UPI001365AA60|nr:extracellular solute-binding protein [Paenibacillus sp. MMS18-CY102]MWC28555.1 extracellular solute-binding protein [Paenibacillus sp. MMS18-CY102]